MMRFLLRRLTLAAVLVGALAAPVAAQDFRGSIVGTITDATGGVLPGVTVTITNSETGIAQTVVTDVKGLYTVLYLNAGTYSVTAQLSGFKKVVRGGMEVKVGEPTRVDLTLETGVMSETVTVQAETPLLNTTTGISGTTINAKQIAQLPLGDGTAYMLTRLAPGIVDSSDLHFARPMDNGNLGGIVTNGVQGGNEFTIDGAPNLSNARGVGFSPPSDAISQFKVQTNAYDAQIGHTAGATVNLALKSGTNAFHFQTGYFNRDASRTETPLLTERAGGTKPTRTYNRFTGTVGGPVIKNRTFFMASYEHLRDVQPEPATYTVPTEKMRAGDFSEFSTLIYDPNTVTSTGTRTAFANNKIDPSRINSVAAAYAALYPLPNRPGTNGNYFTNGLRPYDYNSYLGRVDHNFTSANRMFVSTYYNKRQEDRYNWAQDASNATNNGQINGIAVTQGFDYRSNTGLSGGYTSTWSDTMLMDVRVSSTRFGEWRDPAQTIDPAKLGFSSTAVGLMNGYQYLPFFTFGSFSSTNSGSTISSLGAMRSDWNDGFARPMYTVSISPTLTKVWGEHTSRAGYEYRYQRWNIINDGYPAGRYLFNGAYTRLNNSASFNDRAQSWAQFLLGLPTTQTGTVATASISGVTSNGASQFEIASPGSFRQAQNGLFLQDDWRVSGKLTVNLGARLEINTGMSEVDNRNLAGYDFTTPNPIEGQAQANYAKAPIPEIPVANFHATGGLLFADGPVNNTKLKFLPRGAAEYAVNEKMVVRGGVGLFSYDYFFDNINQAGFSQPTAIITSTDNGITFTGANLTNPIPSGQLTQPVGSALGLQSQLGQNLGTIYQPDRETPYYTRWELSAQRDLGMGFVAAVTYLGSRGSSLPVVQQVNNIPIQYLSTSRTRDAAVETALSANVANPFQGLLPGSAINGATVAKNQLLRPYPQFGTFAIEKYVGSDRYKAITFQLDKRFRSGNSFTMQYTHSSLRDKMNYLNPADGQLEDRVSPNDRPNRFSVGGSVRLPFGREEKWGHEWGGTTDAVLGGWQLSGTYQYQSGFPLTFTNNIYWDASCGDPGSLVSHIGEKVSGGIAGLDVPGWDTKCFYFHDAAVQTNGADDPVKQRADTRINLNNNVRYFPSTLPNVRSDNLHLLDMGLYKNFSLPREMKLQVRFEWINALNYTVLWNPGVDPKANNGLFGIVNTDRNNPRDLQIGLRLTF
ncbi:MAG TPA: carboxypeptidase-like regulatory domain-containing protein [Vicinamibacterales bacterium]|nr:carboxypeptidase-like regulatory domain-containing protein [Vicinamibacterales bacterium]